MLRFGIRIRYWLQREILCSQLNYLVAYGNGYWPRQGRSQYAPVTQRGISRITDFAQILYLPIDDSSYVLHHHNIPSAHRNWIAGTNKLCIKNTSTLFSYATCWDLIRQLADSANTLLWTQVCQMMLADWNSLCKMGRGAICVGNGTISNVFKFLVTYLVCEWHGRTLCLGHWTPALSNLFV